MTPFQTSASKYMYNARTIASKVSIYGISPEWITSKQQFNTQFHIVPNRYAPIYPPTPGHSSPLARTIIAHNQMQMARVMVRNQLSVRQMAQQNTNWA